MKKQMLLMLLVAASTMLFSCNGTIEDIPAGYVGKVLAPTGWNKELVKSGQIDIGNETDGKKSSLVLLETTTCTVKEQFLKDDSADKTDHRVVTKNGTPLSTDAYVMITVPDDDAIRNGVFSMFTAEPDANDKRRSYIRINTIYDKLVKQSVRGIVRTVFSKYETYEDIMKNYEAVNAEIATKIIEVAKMSNAPFKIISVQLSNVKEDDAILNSKNQLVATDNEVQRIKKINDALAASPKYLEKYRLDVMLEVGKANKNLILMDTRGPVGVNLPAQQ